MASSAWQKRNAAARAKGYRNYYDYRAHDFGKMPPGTPRASGEKLRRLRGHASTSDLNRAIASGRVELVNVVQTGSDPPTFDVLVVMSDGSQRRYTLKGEQAVARFTRQLEAEGPDGEPARLRVIGTPNAKKRLDALAEEQELEAAIEEYEATAGEEADEPYTFSDDDIPF